MASRKNEKLVSVIVPARNEEALIRGTVEAALAAAARFHGQSGFTHLDDTAIEVIVVDNASTDRTPDVLGDLVQDYGVQLVCCGKIKASCARNLGASMAHGRILVFLDADTLMPEDALARIHELCVGGYEGGFTGLAPMEDGLRARVWWGFWEHVRRLPVARAKAMSALMFCTREVFDEFRFDENVEIGEEWSILAGLYASRPERFAYERSLKAVTSSRRMELQPFGYFKVFAQYVWAVLHPSGRLAYTDRVRHLPREAA